MSMNTLPQSAIGLEQFKHQTWAVTLPTDFDYALLFEQETWKHIAAKIQRGDTITVRSIEGSFYADLYVRASDKTWVQVSEIRKIVFDDGGESVAGGYGIKWYGPKALHGVFRVKDNERIKGNFQTKELAAEWLKNHIDQTAA